MNSPYRGAVLLPLSIQIALSIVLILFALNPSSVYAGTDSWTEILKPDTTSNTFRSIAVHPTKPDTIFAGNDSSSVFRTLDGGTSWTSSRIEPTRNYNIVGLVIDPSASKSDTVIFAATDSGGVYHSIDAGLTWSPINNGLTDTNLTALVISSSNSLVLYTSSDSGVYKTIDKGTNWFPMNTGLDSNNVSTITIDPNDPNTLYAGTSTGDIYLTVNGGASWSRRNTTSLSSSISDIIVNPENSNTIYISTSNDGIYISTSKGTSPSSLSTGLTETRILSLAIDTSSINKVYAGSNTDGAFQLSEGDTTWSAINTGLTNGVIYALAFSPSRSHEIIAGTQGLGVFSYLGNRSPVMTPTVDQVITADSTLQFSVYAFDPDTLETRDLIFGAIGLPSGASYDSFATHTFQWTPDTSAAGIDTVIFNVQDLRGGSDQDTVLITVNRSPVFTSIAAQTVNENDSLSLSIAATDADGDSVTYRVSTLLPSGETTVLPSGASFDTLTGGSFVWTPPYSTVDRGSGMLTYTVTFSALDGVEGGITYMVVPITVQDVNQAPTIQGLEETYTVSEGNVLEFEVQGNDADLDPLSYGVVDSLPTGASFDSLQSHVFAWIPTYADSGSHEVIFIVNDGRGGTGMDTVTIRVTQTNQNPVLGALSDTFFVNVNDSLTFTVTATDADSDSLSYNSSGLPTGAIFRQSTTQEFLWIPNFFQNGIYDVTFNAADGRGGFAFKKVYIVVNHPPNFEPIESIAVNEGDTVEFWAVAKDLDSDSLVFTVNDLPTGATRTDTTDSVKVDWITGFSDAGTYTITFIVSDGRIGRDTSQVQITVANVNQIPVFDALGSQSVNIGNLLQFTVNATDFDEQVLTYTAMLLPAGAAFNSSTRQFNWTPLETQVGTDTARFQVSDPVGAKDTLQILITVVDQNFAPVFSEIDDKEIMEGRELVFTVIATDANRDTLVYNISGLPTGAVFDTSVHPASLFRWTPSFTQAGSYTVIFSASDRKGGLATQNVNITVSNVNQAPTLSFDSDTTIQEGVAFQLNLNAVDPDGDPVTVSLSTGSPEGAEIQQSGTDYLFSWTPGFLQAGVYGMTVIVQDTSDSSAAAALNITVANVNRLPSQPAVIYPKNGETMTPQSYLIWQRSYDPDPDDIQSYTIQFNQDNTFPSASTFTAEGVVIDSTFLGKAARRSGSTGLRKEEALFKSIQQEQLTNGVEAVAVRINDLVGFQQNLQDNGTYFWRVRGEDDRGGESAYSPGTNSFLYNATNSSPNPVSSGFTPGSGNVINTLTPMISWDPAVDPDPEDTATDLQYKVELDDNEFSSGSKYIYMSGKGKTTVSVTTPLADDHEWNYRIQAIDDEGAESYYSDTQIFYTNTVNDPPRAFSLSTPSNNEDINPGQSEIEFNWEPTVDPDPKDSLTFSVEISQDSLFQNGSIIISTDEIPGDKISTILSTILLPRTKYFWRVTARDLNGLVTVSNQVWSFTLGDGVTAVDDNENIEGIPTEFTLLQNYPNPFNGETIVRFGLPYSAPVRVGVYNLLGQLVQELISGKRLQAGWHLVRWNGKDGEDQPVAAGIYIIRMKGGNFTFSKKAVYVK